MRSFPRRNRVVLIAIASVVVVFACAFISMMTQGGYAGRPPRNIADVAYESTNAAYAMATPAPTAMATPSPNAAYRVTAGGSGGAEQEQQPETGRRIVLRSATINITVEDTVARVNEIGSMAEGLGGWIVTSTTSISGGTPEHPNVYGNITIRVPAETFDTAMIAIREMASIVNNEQITGQDVTQDYVDTSSRLRNLETAELQLQTIMAGAATVEEVLSVYNQLVSTRNEIEVARGRLQYYDQAAAFSSIVVTLNPVPVTATPAPAAVVYGWNPMVTVTRGVEGLVRFSQSAVDALITIAIYVLPVALVLGLPVSMFWRQFKRSRRVKRETVVQTTSDLPDVQNAAED